MKTKLMLLRPLLFMLCIQKLFFSSIFVRIKVEQTQKYAFLVFFLGMRTMTIACALGVPADSGATLRQPYPSWCTVAKFRYRPKLMCVDLSTRHPYLGCMAKFRYSASSFWLTHRQPYISCSTLEIFRYSPSLMFMQWKNPDTVKACENPEACV